MNLTLTEAIKRVEHCLNMDESYGSDWEAWLMVKQATGAMNAIAERYINEVSFLDSSDAGVVRSFVAYLQQQHQ